jgi:hypothetical protein
MMDLYIKLSVCVPRLIPGRGFYAQISSEITSEFLGVTLGLLYLYQSIGSLDIYFITLSSADCLYIIIYPSVRIYIGHIADYSKPYRHRLSITTSAW